MIRPSDNELVTFENAPRKLRELGAALGIPVPIKPETRFRHLPPLPPLRPPVMSDARTENIIQRQASEAAAQGAQASITGVKSTTGLNLPQ
jgi:hypothetical protein